jgi:hypothetical protein
MNHTQGRAPNNKPARKTKARKTKKSYTLSPESVEFLESQCKKRHESSVSSVLDAILQSARLAQGRASVEKAFADYYASLSHADVEEQASWGDFALREFPNEEA